MHSLFISLSFLFHYLSTSLKNDLGHSKKLEEATSCKHTNVYSQMNPPYLTVECNFEFGDQYIRGQYIEEDSDAWRYTTTIVHTHKNKVFIGEQLANLMKSKRLSAARVFSPDRRKPLE